MVHMEAWLNKVDEISAEGPSYKLGHDGSDGTCDCIGLIIGALNRCGVKWPGIHGSNWAARNAMAWMLPVASAEDLSVGDIVYKARRPGETGYSLPDRYAADPDRSDYYHVGVVRSVEPLRIVHCTSPGGVVVDTKVGKWAYHGALSLRQDGSLISAGTRINWGGVIKRAAVDLWDTAENTPDAAPTLWEDIAYRQGYRIIPATITSGSAFAQGECGWWGDVLYRSTIASNVWTPEAYPAGWEAVQ